MIFLINARWEEIFTYPINIIQFSFHDRSIYWQHSITEIFVFRHDISISKEINWEYLSSLEVDSFRPLRAMSRQALFLNLLSLTWHQRSKLPAYKRWAVTFAFWVFLLSLAQHTPSPPSKDTSIYIYQKAQPHYSHPLTCRILCINCDSKIHL